jgi:hypothetical protein
LLTENQGSFCIEFKLLGIIQNCYKSIEYYTECEQSLQINDWEPEEEIEVYEETEESESITGESSQTESIPSSPMKRLKTMVSFEDKRRAVEFWKSGKKKRLSLGTVSHQFRFITSVQQLYEFEKQVETQGSRNDKLKEIWSYTFQEFMSAR